MTDEIPNYREEALQTLAAFCRALDEALRGAGLGPEEALVQWCRAVSAECVRCGLRVSGEELFALSQPPSGKYGSVKLGRLRLGDCARCGCKSNAYRLTFWNYERLDWPALLAHAEAIRRRQTKPKAPTGLWTGLSLSPGGWAKVGRCCAGLALVVVLLLAWHWRRGGSIPLLRQPEHFLVDPDPAEETALKPWP